MDPKQRWEKTNSIQHIFAPFGIATGLALLAFLGGPPLMIAIFVMTFFPLLLGFSVANHFVRFHPIAYFVLGIAFTFAITALILGLLLGSSWLVR